MRDYLVYGVCAEIEDRVNETELRYIGSCVWEDDIVHSVKQMTEQGYYQNFPADSSPQYKKTLTQMVRNPRNYGWDFNNTKNPCTLEEIDLFTGEIASLILSPEELWDCERFVFKNPTSMVATISAYIVNASRIIDIREGYKWVNEGIETEISGDVHADLRIYQTDVRHHKTIDPFGYETMVRPISRSMVAPYHTTEATLLVATMKYAEQMGIEINYPRHLEWGKSLGQRGGFCTEHFGGFDQNSTLFFIGYDRDITEKGHPIYYLPCLGGEDGYGIHIDQGDMVLKYDENIRARFKPNDAEELIKGLIYQCANGLGRTSAKQMFDLIEYRFSDKFVKEIINGDFGY